MTRIQTILQQMSLQDKLAELTQLYGEATAGDTFMGIDYRFDTHPDLRENAGSLLGVSGAKLLRHVQEQHLRKSRHKIPLLFMHDIIHGYKTIFPSPLAMSCTWQPQLVRQAARAAAKEAAVSGLHLTFSPMCDLARDARWGRVVETSGEDVWLNSLFVQAYVEGYQGEDVSAPYSLAACIKHFAAYGLAEGGRDYNTTEASEYTLREHHFPAYQAGIAAGAKMVMTSFNALNGVPATGNRWLFQDILRGEWQFDGTVISDCTAVIEMIYHGFARNEAEAAEKALHAGVDIEMVSNTYYNHAQALLEQNKITLEQIDGAVLRVLALKEQLGLFENPYKDADEGAEREIHLCPAHLDLSQDIARQSMVLLKNQGALPLQRGAKVALLGPLAQSRQMLDIWSAYGEESQCATLQEALQDHLNLCCHSGTGPEALALAGDCDVILLALGESPDMSGESNSRMDIGLSKSQARFAREVFALGKPVVVVLYSGRPLAIPELAEKADAILLAWLPGTRGNQALAQLLLGEADPSGRLTMSFPWQVGQCPLYYDRYSTGRPAQDPVHSAPFSSRYVDGPSTPLYPFGHGLTYTRFAYSRPTLSAQVLTKGQTLTASCRITNTGQRSGTETVQLYLRDLYGSRVRPIRMLKDFQRVHLQPGESREVQFTLREEQLCFHTLDQGFAAEEGAFQVHIAPDASVDNGAEFEWQI